MRMVIIEVWEKIERQNGMNTERRLRRYTECFSGSIVLSGMTYDEKIDYAKNAVAEKFGKVWNLGKTGNTTRYLKHHKGNQ